MRISNLIASIENAVLRTAPRVARAAHTANIEIAARAAVIKVLMLEQAMARTERRAERAARKNAQRLVEQMEIANRALQLLAKRNPELNVVELCDELVADLAARQHAEDHYGETTP